MAAGLSERDQLSGIAPCCLFLHNGGNWEDAEMATLNIKNLPDRIHRKLRERAAARHRSVAQEVTHLLAEALDAAEPLSILELRGLGKDRWAGKDAAARVAEERRSWD
ncbi:MAG TPA: hypothetical protein VJB16_04875 [archaeon]|nr:hypothetical protein [archaeon]